jgi:hypothetical protein
VPFSPLFCQSNAFLPVFPAHIFTLFTQFCKIHHRNSLQSTAKIMPWIEFNFLLIFVSNRNSWGIFFIQSCKKWLFSYLAFALLTFTFVVCFAVKNFSCFTECITDLSLDSNYNTPLHSLELCFHHNWLKFHILYEHTHTNFVI